MAQTRFTALRRSATIAALFVFLIAPSCGPESGVLTCWQGEWSCAEDVHQWSCFQRPTQPPASEEKVVIYVIDTSQSMTRGDLYGRLLDELQQRYMSLLRPGDMVAVLTFDSFTRREFASRYTDDGSIRRRIQSLGETSPTGQFTYLVGAVREAAQWAEELKAAETSDGADVFIFTDGVNDPPPNASGPTNWRQLAEDEFAGQALQNPDLGVYLVQLPGAPSLASDDLPSGVSVVDRPPSGDRLTASRLEFERTHFLLDTLELVYTWEGQLKNDSLTSRSLEIRASEVFPPGEEKVVLVRAADSYRISLQPDSFSFNRRGDARELTFEFATPRSVRSINLQIKIAPVSEGLAVDSALFITIPARRIDKAPPFWVRLPWLLPVIGLILLGVIVCRIRPSFEKQTIVVDSIPYSLAKHSTCVRRSVAIGGSKIPLSQPGLVARVRPLRGGRAKLIPKKEGVEINGMPADSGGIQLTDGDLISAGGDTFRYQTTPF